MSLKSIRPKLAINKKSRISFRTRNLFL